jgi:Mg-chelatase subunit ChlI
VEQGRAVSSYFAEYLLPRPEAMDALQLVLDAADSLAATVDIGGVGRRLQGAIDAASKVEDIKGPAGIPYRKYNDFARNNYALTKRNIEEKRRLSALSPAQRLQELVVVYLGESPLSVPSMEIFAARLIRAFARDDGREAVYAAFGQVIDVTVKSQLPKPRKDFLIHRAAQAILYLQGKLTFPQEEAYDAIASQSPNFLWDDIG